MLFRARRARQHGLRAMNLKGPIREPDALPEGSAPDPDPSARESHHLNGGTRRYPLEAETSVFYLALSIYPPMYLRAIHPSAVYPVAQSSCRMPEP